MPTETLPPDHDERMERARRCLEGLSLGDAFGERFSGHKDVVQGQIARRELPGAPWQWTDDTAMAAALVEVLAEHGRVELDALAAALAARYEAEPWRGYGAQTHILLGKIHGGGNWRELARAINDGQGSYGNDAAARVAPLGAYFQDDGDERIAAQARLSAEVTHSHPLARDGAAAVALAAAWMGRQGEAIAAGEADSDGMFALVLEHVREEPLRALIEQARALSADTPVRDVTDALGCGRQVTAQDTVPFCLWAAARNAGNFEAAMWTTVSGLGDRDTNCAIVGGIVAAGAGVPGGWVKRRERV